MCHQHSSVGKFLHAHRQREREIISCVLSKTETALTAHLSHYPECLERAHLNVWCDYTGVDASCNHSMTTLSVVWSRGIHSFIFLFLSINRFILLIFILSLYFYFTTGVLFSITFINSISFISLFIYTGF